MGLMKKAVRRATPRPVRKAKAVVKHPVGTAINAATPRSVRKAKRRAFKIAHPINTAENAMLNAATPSRSLRRSQRPAQAETAMPRSEPRTDPGRRSAAGKSFRQASGKDERVVVVIVSAGERRGLLAARMRQRQVFGEWTLPPSSESRWRIRRGLRKAPYFLLADAPVELGQRIITAYGEVGARVELWVPEGETHGGVPDQEHGAEGFPARITQAWLDREVPDMSPSSFARLLDLLAERGWGSEEIEERVISLRPTAAG
jgi:hypothetical protein